MSSCKLCDANFEKAIVAVCDGDEYVCRHVIDNQLECDTTDLVNFESILVHINNEYHIVYQLGYYYSVGAYGHVSYINTNPVDLTKLASIDDVEEMRNHIINLTRECSRLQKLINE